MLTQPTRFDLDMGLFFSKAKKTVKLARLGGKDPDADEKLREGHGAWPCHECLVGAPISCTSWVEAVRSILG